MGGRGAADHDYPTARVSSTVLRCLVRCRGPRGIGRNVGTSRERRGWQAVEKRPPGLCRSTRVRMRAPTRGERVGKIPAFSRSIPRESSRPGSDRSLHPTPRPELAPAHLQVRSSHRGTGYRCPHGSLARGGRCCRGRLSRPQKPQTAPSRRESFAAWTEAASWQHVAARW